MTARITRQMSDNEIVEACRDEMDAAFHCPGGGAFLKIEPLVDEQVMRLIVNQADELKKLRARISCLFAWTTRDDDRRR